MPITPTPSADKENCPGDVKARPNGTTPGAPKRDVAVSRARNLQSAVGLGESLDIMVPVAVDPGTEVRIVGLPANVGRIGASVVGPDVQGRKLDVSVESGESLTKVFIRGNLPGTGAMWLMGPNGRRAWHVARIRAGIGQDAVAQEVKVVRVVVRVTRDGKPASSSMLMCNYSKDSGMSKVPGMMLRPVKIAQLDSKGTRTLNLPVGSTWSFSILGGKTLSLRGQPANTTQLIGPGTRMIELQQAIK